jgi:hypothetical protein
MTKIVKSIMFINTKCVCILLPAENEAIPVLQLSVVQHLTTKPDKVVPCVIAMHGEHEYTVVAMPLSQTEVVLSKFRN